METETKETQVQNETPVSNAYEEEKTEVEATTKERIELGLNIQAILDDYGYDLVAVDVAGTPTVRFVKRV